MSLLPVFLRRVDLFTLRLFLAAIDEGRIGRAAEREHIVPSAATRRIQDLEELAGLQLFERNPRGVAPSAAGRVVARHARAMLASLEAMHGELAALTDGGDNRLAVASPRLLLVHFLAAELGAFSRAHPAVAVHVREEVSPDALVALEAGEVDLAVYSRSADSEREALRSLECRSDRLVAVVPADHPLAREASVSLSMLLEQDLIGIGPRTTVMSNLRHAAATIGREPRVKYSVSSVEAALSLARAGLGVVLQPACMPAPATGDGLVSVPVDGDWALRSYRVAWHAARPLSACAQALIAQLVGNAASESRLPEGEVSLRHSPLDAASTPSYDSCDHATTPT